MVEVIGCPEIGRLLARSWRSHFQMHYCSVADFDTGLVTLVLEVRRHRGACKLRNSCFRLRCLGAGTELQGLDPSVCATLSEIVTAWYRIKSIVGLDGKTRPSV